MRTVVGSTGCLAADLLFGVEMGGKAVAQLPQYPLQRNRVILRPLCPSDRMLDQLGLASEHVIPEYHRR